MKEILFFLTLLALAAPVSAWGGNHDWWPYPSYGPFRSPWPVQGEDTYRDRQERRLEEMNDELRRMREIQEDREYRENLDRSFKGMQWGPGR